MDKVFNVYTGFLAIMALWFIIIIGWVSNIFWLVAISEEMGNQFFIALTGVVVIPLGVVHGWFVLF